jgi:hypothetical protein
MVISVTKDTLVKQFLIEHNIELALVVTGPLKKEDLTKLHRDLDLTTMANGDYVIFVDPPIANYEGIRGWLWANDTLMDISH